MGRKLYPFSGLVIAVFSFLITVLPSQVQACDSTPVLQASNVQIVGTGPNYTVDFNICMGINGSQDGFDLQIGCGLNILSVAPTSLTNGANTATASIVGNTVTFNCGACNAANWFEPDDFVAGPCFAFTATVTGNPENCPYTVTGINDGCLIIATSWSATVPGPCITDFNINGPGTHSSTTTGAGNDCNLRSSLDRTYAINLPCNDLWTFSLCGGSSWDTYLYLGSTCCASDLGQNDDFCGLQSSITANTGPGTVYLTVEAFGSSSGTYTLNVTGANGCPLDITDQITLNAAPNPGGTSVDIDFQVDTEANVAEYILERSSDGNLFLPMEEFSPKGLNPTGAPTEYRFRDHNVKQDVSYAYRVHVHTTTGEVFDTDPVFVFMNADDGLQAGAFYPHPASAEANIVLGSQTDAVVTARVYDVRGAVVQERPYQVHAGNTVLKMDFADLAEGTYFVRFSDPKQGTVVRKVVRR